MVRRFEARPRHARRVLCVGSITQDHIYRLESTLVVGTKHRTTPKDDIGGGVAANAAVTIARLGGRATLLGAIGADPVGDLVLEELRTERVEVQHVRRLASHSTPESIIIVEPNGERTIIADPTIDLTRLPVPDLPTAEFDAVLVDARWSAATRRALEMAQQQGSPASSMSTDCPPNPTCSTPRVTSCSASRRSSSSPGPTTSSPVCTMSPGTTDARLSVTAGERGVCWLDDGTAGISMPLTSIPSTPPAPATCSTARSRSRLAEGTDEADAFRFASATAALKCSRPGARAGIPSRADVEELLTVTRPIPT